MAYKFNPFTGKLDISGTTGGGGGGIGGSTGAVDNAILRADGTGGATLQNSGLIVEDAIVSYAVTGDAATDVITAVGHNFTTNQGVVFPILSGGSGLSVLTTYFVINISGNTFQLSLTSGGAAIDFTTDITSGTIVAIQANVTLSQNTTEAISSLVLTPKASTPISGGAFIVGQKPNGLTSGGNVRGPNATDLQRLRSSATMVASGNQSFIGSGQNNTASGSRCIVLGGFGNTVSGSSSIILNGSSNNVSGDFSVVLGGSSNRSSALYTSSGGNSAWSDRAGMQSYSSGSFVIQGDSQRASFVLRCITTTNTGVEMALNTFPTYLGIPSGKVMAMTMNISGVKSDGTAVAHYVRQYAVKNVAGTSSQVYAPVTIGSDNPSGTSIALSVNDSDDTIRILVTGIASETWRWVATVDAVEIVYGT